jgi:hypothetical protein
LGEKMSAEEWQILVDGCLNRIDELDRVETSEIDAQWWAEYNTLWDYFDDLMNAVPYEVRCPEPPCWGDAEHKS